MRKLLTCLAAGLLLVSCNPPESAEDLAATATPEPTVTAASGGPQMEACEDHEPELPNTDDLQDTEEKPQIEVPDGAPPCELVEIDIVEGEGAKAKDGATVTIHYVGVSWSTGEEFDSSWDHGDPATFPLGNLIPGWQEGIPGLKEGGRRALIIPPDLGYGDQGSQDGSIAPGETLIFVIDMIDPDAQPQ